MKDVTFAVVLSAILAAAAVLPKVQSIDYEVVAACSSGRGGGPPKNGLRVRMTESEFFDSYARTFEMSDGSKMKMMGDGEESGGYDSRSFRQSIRYASSMMRMVGIEEIFNTTTTTTTGSATTDMMTFQVCGPAIADIFMLSIVGNFVTSPSEYSSGSSSLSDEPLASVAIDVYTGKLTLVNSFSVVRSYFLEAMLVISVLAIAKLSIVRTVKIKFISKKET